MTKDWYFFLQKGRADGPHTPEEVAKAIETGRLGPHDLIYKDGAEKWLPGHQFIEFRKLFKMTIKAEIDDGWVVLTKIKNDKGINYLQKGPFPTAKVRELLKGGYVQYRDFIWKEGQLKWQRISSVDVFNPPPVQWQAKTKLPQDVDENDSQQAQVSDVLFNQPATQAPDQPSEVASGEVYEVTKTDITKVRKAPRTPGHKDPIAERRAQDRRTQERRMALAKASLPEPSWRKRLPLLPTALAALIIGVVTVSYIHREEIGSRLGWKIIQKETKERAPKPIIAKPVKVVQPAPVVPVPTPAPPPEPVLPRVAPTRLTVLFNGSPTSPELKFSTDASHHFAIQVKVVGQAGEVLDRVSVFREVTVRRKPDEDFTLNLKTMELGDGPYRIEAESEGVRATQGIRLGRKDAEFGRQLARHRKLISLPYQRERRRLIRATAALNKLADSLAANGTTTTAWRQEMSRFRGERFDGVNLRKPQTLVFPELWEGLALAYDDLQKSVGGGRSEIEKRRLAIKKLKEKAASLSLYD